jgi:hypothetical protein
MQGLCSLACNVSGQFYYYHYSGSSLQITEEEEEIEPAMYTFSFLVRASLGTVTFFIFCPFARITECSPPVRIAGDRHGEIDERTRFSSA